ncbi:MAG TPA: hypothetical protein VFI19_06230 [Nocardioides sp.]|nr:hypothetical protein [Nocardioides sp.]
MRARPLAMAAVVLGLVGLAALPAVADDHSEPVRGHYVTRDDGNGPTRAYTATKTLTRKYVQDDGTPTDVVNNTVTVTASPTTDLRGRQRVLIRWTGAQPSGGRAANPYGENGLAQEYPVVILQCRGVDDPNAPADQQVRPDTCWTNSVAERSQVARGDSEATWIHDLYADPSQRERLSMSGDTPFPGTDDCPNANVETLYTHLTPFISAKGTRYMACDAKNMPPEAGVGAAYPPNEIAAFSDENGSGSVEFEVRTDVENESLGCSHDVACTIEVIPINGLSCEQSSNPPSISDSACRKGGQWQPGSSNFASQGVDQAVSWPLWWSASNWDNRIPIPVTFGLPPDVCDVLDPRPPTGFYGSELIAQASLQWAPAYCLNEHRFKFQNNVMPDAAGFSVMDSGGGPAAFVSSAHKGTGDDPIGYAPTAVTGFGIGYVIDRPDNGGEYTELKLNARLVAKLLTQSYLGSILGRGHPGIGENPLGLMNDPEFMKLNPGLSDISQEAGATLLSISVGSDVLQQLTDWISQDKDAMAFIDGKADPWGMKVNPAYKGIKVPKDEWPLKDTYVPQTNDPCRQHNPAVYFSQLAAPVSNLRTIAQALLDGWPNVQTRCDFDQVSNTYKLGRKDRQSYGARFMLGLVSLGDAQRYGLRVASLETKHNTFVGPSDRSLSAAVDMSRQPTKHGKAVPGSPFVLDQAEVRRSTEAYPGTMVVYTAARERDLDQADADKVAQFIRVATTEGQKSGTGNGELPPGFLPIEDKGVTKKLFESAQDVADRIEKQTPLPSEGPEPTKPPSSEGAPTLPPNPDSGPPPVSDAPGGDAPSDAPPTAAATPTTTATVVMPKTEAVDSDMGNHLVPLLLVIGLGGLALTRALRFFVRPPNGPGA